MTFVPKQIHLLLTCANFQIGLLSVTRTSKPVFLARLAPARGSGEGGLYGDKRFKNVKNV